MIKSLQSYGSFCWMNDAANRAFQLAFLSVLNHASLNCDSHSNTCLDGSVTFDLSVDIALWD